ncbi:MAG: hypothetical protein OHK0022_03620 [Roseiflexaceae bacterium]
MNMPQNEGFELDLSDLEIERVSGTETAAGVEGLTLWSQGHGTTEIGASCCTSGQQQNGSCSVDTLA